MARSTSLLPRNATRSPLGFIAIAGHMRRSTWALPKEPWTADLLDELTQHQAYAG